MLKMEQCPHCEKKMPKHILIKHLAKTHGLITETNIEGKIVTSTEEVKKDDGEVKTTPENSAELITESPEPKKWYEKWDAGEINVCAQCHQEFPSRIMGWHIRFEHGL